MIGAGRPIRVGLNVYPQQTTWDSFRENAVLAEGVGIDSLWTWDHLYGVSGSHQSIFEGWTLVAAMASMTEQATVGLLVCANTFRNPGVVAKSAVTLDHLSGGRFVLGIGSGYQEREHRAHGIDFGLSPGQRLAWLDEALGIIRSLTSGETVTTSGGHYSLIDASHRPLPVRGRLPVLVGGGGERRTIPIVARYADMWHVRGDIDVLRRKLDLLDKECGRYGRTRADVELVIGNPVVIRAREPDARAVLDAALRHNDLTISSLPGTPWLGSPQRIAELWRPFVDLGFRHLIVDLLTPYDSETVARLPEVRAILEAEH